MRRCSLSCLQLELSCTWLLLVRVLRMSVQEDAVLAPWGLVANRSHALTLRHWPYQRGLHYVEQAIACGDPCISHKLNRAITFVHVFDADFSHAALNLLPRLQLACDWLSGDGHDVTVLVQSRVVASMVSLWCPILKRGRVEVVDYHGGHPGPCCAQWNFMVSARQLYVVSWKYESESLLGLVPPRILSRPGRFADKEGHIVWLSRGTERARAVRNEQEVLEHLRSCFGPQHLVVYNDWTRSQDGHPSFALERRFFRNASIIIGPHGGALPNMIFAPPAVHVVEILDMVRLRLAGEPARPCHFGLAVALGHSYEAVAPAGPPWTKESFSQSMEVDIKLLLAALSCA